MSGTVARIDEPLSDETAERFAHMLNQFAQAMQPVIDAWVESLRSFLVACEPLLKAYERQERLKRVYRRWNHPLLRADMHSRKCEKGRATP